MMNMGGNALGNIATKERRINAIIQRLGKTSHDAEELAAAYTSMRNRVLGEAPPDTEAGGKPIPVNNGSLHQIEEIELRINQSLNQLRTSLGELETAL